MPLGARAYDIAIGPGLLAEAPRLIAPFLARPRLAILTEERVAALHLSALREAFAGAGIETSALALAPGEATKGWRGLEQATEWLIAEKVERDDLVLAFGGGVIGDLAGFAAAILRRGVGFVRRPPRCSPRSTAPSAARPASTRPAARTSSGPSTSRASCWPTPRCSTRCRPATSSRATARW